MNRLVLCLVLTLSGCDGLQEGKSPQPPPAAKQDDPAKPALRTRLSLVTEEPVVGKQILLQLELVNEGGEAVVYDDQQADINNSLRVTGPEGKAVPYIHGGAQTGGALRLLESGTSVVLFDKLDLASQYLVARPGRYEVRFSGRGISALHSRGSSRW